MALSLLGHVLHNVTWIPSVKSERRLLFEKTDSLKLYNLAVCVTAVTLPSSEAQFCCSTRKLAWTLDYGDATTPYA